MKPPPDPAIAQSAAGRRAVAQAEAVESWWHDQGHPQVQAWVEAQTSPKGDSGGPIYAVRSNLVGGGPPPRGGR